MFWASMRRSFIAAFILALGGTLALAQSGTTSLRGTVLDKSGAAIVGAKVTLSSESQGLHRDTTTNSAGGYEFTSLTPGTYSLTVEMSGFRKYDHGNLELLVNAPATENVTLQIGSNTETVEVSAQAAAINTTDASLGVAFNNQQVKELPMESRNVPDLLTLQAGVVYIGNNPQINTMVDTRSGAVNGARSDQSNVTLDGVAVNNRNGDAFTSVLPVTLDSVEEFRVTTTNYNPDQGGSGGAQVSLVTKSGTNNFHGSAYEYNRNTATSANDYFNKQAQINTCLANGEPLNQIDCNQAPKLVRNIFGGSVGGPIKKDRLFFFANYEGTRRSEGQVVNTVVPSDTARDGIVEYPCATASQCPGGSVTGLSGQSYTLAPGNYALSPQAIQAIDPLGIGVNPNVISFLNSGYWPHSNSAASGDGLNTLGYVFSSPISLVQDWYIAKVDYNVTQDGKHRISVSGALANVSNPGAQFLPGQAPEDSLVNYNKGIIVGYTGVITNSIVNNFRYGFVRESVGQIGNSNQQWIILRGLNDQTGAITRTQQFQRPINTFSDDVSWSHGRHTFQFGGVVGIVRDATANFGTSFSDGVVNSAWLDTGGITTTPNSPLNPTFVGLPAVNGDTFGLNYDFAVANALGFVSEVDASYNYLKNGSVQPQGAPVARHYAEDRYEIYGQDTWKATSTLTLTIGLRYSLFSPPWETGGLQVAPSPNLGAWFNQRLSNWKNGVPSSADAPISFDLAGPANGGRPGYYNWDYKDLAPRFAFAWAPAKTEGILGALFGGAGRTSIRGGFGMVYDNVGESLINTFDQNGAFGLSTSLSNPAGSESVNSSPRLTDMHTIPATDLNGGQILLPAPPGQFPQTFPSTLDTGGFAIAWGLDNTIKTPYAYTLDLSMSRQLKNGFSVEAAYVGRLGHRLMAQEDVAQPYNFVDKSTGIDYYAAVGALAKLYRQNVPTSQITAATVGPTAAYWKNIIQPLKPGGAYSLICSGGSTQSALQAAYDLFSCNSTNETTALSILDGQSGAGGIPDANLPNVLYNPTDGPFTFFNPQYSSLYAWRNVGTTSYNAFEFTVRHTMIHGFQFDANYTYSKSIDLASDALRIGAFGGGLGNQITNAWEPNQLRGVSDYDLRHQFNTNFIVDMPFGQGKAIGHDVGKPLNALIGGWQVTGLFRMTSGFPVNIGNVFGFPTNWELTGLANLTGHIDTGNGGHHAIIDGNGNPNISVFANGPNALSSFSPALPGFSGARNQVRGEGYRGLDVGLAKRWTMPWSDGQSLQFRWEVYNVTNTPIFNVQTAQINLYQGPTFGNYTSLLNQPRVMQFALRYEF
jgi:Carboxypeptidase regulatory-like domain/TonB dependent receptor